MSIPDISESFEHSGFDVFCIYFIILWPHKLRQFSGDVGRMVMLLVPFLRCSVPQCRQCPGKKDGLYRRALASKGWGSYFSYNILIDP